MNSFNVPLHNVKKNIVVNYGYDYVMERTIVVVIMWVLY